MIQEEGPRTQDGEGERPWTLPQNTERGRSIRVKWRGKTAKQGSTITLQRESHRVMVIRTGQRRRSSPQPEGRMQSEVGGWSWEGGKKPHSGKRGHRRPRGRSHPALAGLCHQKPSHTQPTDHGDGAAYKMVHIWPDGAAFPRKTWPRSPRLQPPFVNRRECDQRLTSERAAFLKVTHRLSYPSPGGREALLLHLPRLASEKYARDNFQAFPRPAKL